MLIVVTGQRKVEDAIKIKVKELSEYPLLSIIVPARNEENDIKETVKMHLQTDYPKIELTVIDDRSTDRTGPIVKVLAHAEPRLKLLSIKELPPRWLGKVHAMHAGFQAADGEWILFTDADVQIKSGFLKTAIALCKTRNVDFLTVIPFFTHSSIFLDACITFAARTILGGGQIWKLNDPRSRRAGGFGAFLLLRREAFYRTPGFEWMKMEIADDIALGQMMKAAGARCAVINAKDSVRLPYCRTMSELMHSLGKGSFGIIGRYSLARLFMIAAPVTILEIGWIAGLMPVHISFLPLLSIAGAGLNMTSAIIFARWLDRPVFSALCYPVGSFLNTIFSIRSGILAVKNKGIGWRDTFYPTNELRPGQRVRFL